MSSPDQHQVPTISASEVRGGALELFERTFQVGPTAMTISTFPGGRLIMANDRFYRMTGWAPDETRGRSLTDHIDFLDADKQRQITADLLTHGHTSDVILGYRTKDGEIRYAMSSSELIVHDEESFVLTSSQDMTEHMRTREVLRESEARFRELFDAVEDGLLLTDLETLALSMPNRRMCAMLGLDEAQVSALTVMDIHPPDALEAVREIFTKHATEALNSARDVPLLVADGSVLYTDVNATPMLIGGRQHVLGIFHDVTERRRGEERLRRINETLVSLGDDHQANIDELTALSGDLLEATYAIYFRLDGDVITIHSRWQVPDDVVVPDTPEGPIFGEIVRQGGENALLARGLGAAEHPSFEAMITRHGIETFFGHVVISGGSRSGCLALFFDRDVVPSRDDHRLLAITALALGGEEERHRAEQERQGHVRFLEGLDRVNQAIQRSSDPRQTLWDVVGIMRELFGVDRAWLVAPRRPGDPLVPLEVEVSSEEYPGALAKGTSLYVHPEDEAMHRHLVQTDGPVTYGPGGDAPLRSLDEETFGIRSAIQVALFPKTGEPWVLGMHQCSYARVWRGEERRLFEELGRRLADHIGNMLVLDGLTESERNYRTLVENQPIGVVIHRPSGEILFANRRLATMLHFESPDQLVGENVIEFVHPDFVAAVISRFDTVFATMQAQPPAEEQLVCRDGSVIDTEITGAPTTFMGQPCIQVMILDITERKRSEERHKALEAQLRQSQKLEAIGQLAGGVAHDFNNILTVIMGNAELMMGDIRERLTEDDPLMESVVEVQEAATRASTLTRQLLTFSRRDVTKPESLDLNVIVRGLDKMLRRLVSEGIVFDIETAPSPCMLVADPGQLEQVIVNLVVNAVQAMPEGGRLTLQTSNVVIDEGYTSFHAEGREGPYVQLEVTDTGVGIDTDTMGSIFDPFFTTKPRGKGSGLGLSMVHGIVKRAGGHVQVYSEVDVGTTFKIYLPGSPVPVPSGAPQKQEPRVLHGVETILVCEDDDILRKMTARLLRSAGYTVLTASGGGEALEIFETRGATIDMLLTDVIMGDMNGRHLADLIHVDWPDLPTLFVSGYTANVIFQEGVLEEGLEFLQKPFRHDELLGRVRHILDGEPS